MVTIFGLLQAVPSIVNDSGDQIRCLKAGPTKIVYLFQKSLYFVAISSVGESEAALLSQLYFLYNQILFILTAKVCRLIHHVFYFQPNHPLFPGLKCRFMMS